MNLNQKRVIIVGCAAIILMLLFPPFHLVRHKYTDNMGYSFILTPPKDEPQSTVNVNMLLVQWAAVLMISGMAFSLARGQTVNAKKQPESVKHSAHESLAFGSPIAAEASALNEPMDMVSARVPGVLANSNSQAKPFNPLLMPAIIALISMTAGRGFGAEVGGAIGAGVFTAIAAFGGWFVGRAVSRLIRRSQSLVLRIVFSLAAVLFWLYVCGLIIGVSQIVGAS